MVEERHVRETLNDVYGPERLEEYMELANR